MKSISALDTVQMMDGLRRAYNATEIYIAAMTATLFNVHIESLL